MARPAGGSDEVVIVMSDSEPPSDAPIIVVGGGLGGVAAAASLLEGGRRVLLLEGSGRFGGRTRTVWSAASPGVAVDVGGQWVAPAHTRMLALLRRVGLPLVRQYGAGADLLDDGRYVRRSLHLGTNIPAASPLALLEVELRVIGSIERLAATLPPSDALSSDGGGRGARRLAELDGISVEQWLRRRCWTNGALRLGALTVELLLGVEPAQVSMLCLLRYVQQNRSLRFLVEVDDAAQHAWVAHGGVGRAAGLLVDALRAEHGDGRFEARLDCPVVAVAAPDGGGGGGGGSGLLRVRTAAGEVLTTPHVVMAAPPVTVLQRIALTPAPPAEWRRCAERSFMGCYTKAVALYDAPFWRGRGLSGTCMRLAFDAEHPVQNVYDHSEGASDLEPPPPHRSSGAAAEEADGSATPAVSAAALARPPGPVALEAAEGARGPAAALVCFLAGDAAMLYAGAPEAELHAAVVRSLVRFFGDEAREGLREVVSCEWGADEWVAKVGRPAPQSSAAGTVAVQPERHTRDAVMWAGGARGPLAPPGLSRVVRGSLWAPHGRRPLVPRLCHATCAGGRAAAPSTCSASATPRGTRRRCARRCSAAGCTGRPPRRRPPLSATWRAPCAPARRPPRPCSRRRHRPRGRRSSGRPHAPGGGAAAARATAARRHARCATARRPRGPRARPRASRSRSRGPERVLHAACPSNLGLLVRLFSVLFVL